MPELLKTRQKSFCRTRAGKEMGESDFSLSPSLPPSLSGSIRRAGVGRELGPTLPSQQELHASQACGKHRNPATKPSGTFIN